VDDAESLFLQGLYAIQRAYNLSDKFEDREGSDKTACASGTFNKFIEKLVGVHPDAELKYITAQGALFKLLPLSREATKSHLIKADLEGLTVAALKEKIHASVREQLLFEFGSTAELRALTSPYESFEAFQASEHYTNFQVFLKHAQDTGLELMLEVKLLVADDVLDKEMTKLLVAEGDKKPAAEEAKEALDEKPASQAELRAARLAFFKERKESTGIQPDVPGQNSSQAPDEPRTPRKE
jgi:hypothetical protein